MRHAVRALLALALVGASGPLRAQARQSPWMPSLGGGRIDWTGVRLSPTRLDAGEATAVAIRGSRNVIGRIVGFEWGAVFASFREESRLDPTQTFALDWRALLHTPWQVVQPFVGAGPSLFIYGSNASGRDAFATGYNVGGGVRVQASPGLFLILDARLRGWDFSSRERTTVHEANEITLSLGFRR
jgi:hypothetical protein